MMWARCLYGTRRFERQAMGTFEATPATSKALKAGRPNADHLLIIKRHSLDRSDQSSLARASRTLRFSVENYCKPLLRLAEGWKLWDRLLKALQRRQDAQGELNWRVHYLDSTIVRAHQHAGGAKGGTNTLRRLGYSQGGFSTKVHLRAKGDGKPMVFMLSAGQPNEMVGFETLMERGERYKAGRSWRSSEAASRSSMRRQRIC